MELSDLIAQIHSYNPNANLCIIQQAYEKAKKSHDGQKRASGEDYIIHPLSVAYLLSEIRLDITTIAAGLLHDVIEDTNTGISEIRSEFGNKIADLVEGVSKISKLTHTSAEYRRAESLRKMLLATSNDVRTIIIKLCDRLHNMQTINHLSQSDQMRIAQETMDIYAPLANSIGMGRMRWELEDLSFTYLKKDVYEDIKARITDKRKEREAYLERMKTLIEKELKKAKIQGVITSRSKHFYSIYQKMKKYNKPLDELYDLLGLRVITEDTKDCYSILGIIHSLWKPVPDRFKDYIGNPKTNLYQSLHTTVIGPEGKPIEIQIRTKEMDLIAEEGVAAHWRYKRGNISGKGNTSIKGDEEFHTKLTGLKRVIDWHEDSNDPVEFLESMKLNLFEDSIFVFTPKGEVKELPVNSTPIDFAYSVHSKIGDHCFGAKVNDKIVPLDYQLKSGDRIEIITSSKVHPNRNWLNTVKTPKAMCRIRNWLHKLEETKEIKTEPTANKEDTKAVNQHSIKKDVASLIPSAVTAQGTVSHRKHISSSNGTLVIGAEGLDIYLAKCCHPVPGDKIVGFISRSHGVSVHLQDCANIQHLNNNQKLDAYWKDKIKGSYEVYITAMGFDRKNLLADMLAVIASTTHGSIDTAWGKSQSDSNAKCGFVIDVENITQLHTLIRHLKKVPGVIDVKRG